MRQMIMLAAVSALVVGAAVSGPARAQSSSQNGTTATGDPWMNENDYDYNRQHWTPPSRPTQGQNGYDGRYGYNDSGQYRPSPQYRYRQPPTPPTQSEYDRGYQDGLHGRYYQPDNGE